MLHSDLELARRLEGAEGRSNADFVEAHTKAFPEVGGTWIQVAGCYVMFDGVGSPCTQTFGLGLYGTVGDEDLDEIERFFLDRGSDVFHEVSPLAEAPLLSLLNGRGYRPIELSNVLIQPLAPESGRATSEDDPVQVRRVEAGGHGAWADVAARGWSDVAPELEGYLRRLGPVNALRRETHCFLASIEGTDVAAAALAMWDGVALLAGACTVPEWRKQGAQLGLLEHRLQYAASRGCDVAMVVTQPGTASQRNAERRGFGVAYTRTKWQLVQGGS